MKLLLLAAIVVLMVVIYFLLCDSGEEQAYDKIVGYEVTPAIRKAERRLKVAKTPEAKLKAADINRYNLADQEEADRLYAIALFEAINDNDPIAFAINDRINGPPVEIKEPEIKIRSDPQNVHDSNVTSALRQKCEIIKRGRFSKESEMHDFEKHLTTKARLGYDYITNHPGHIEAWDITDVDILSLIVGRDRALWPALVTNLETIIENGSAVCVMGRAGRLLDSLTLIDKEAGAPPISTDILRKEIMDSCSNAINKLSETDRAKYEEDEEYAREFGDQMIADIKKTYAGQNPAILDKICEEVRLAF